ncbi:hypothetical protein BJ138DRAFT_966385, partial [Hygrophoropsis aurantiaca]
GTFLPENTPPLPTENLPTNWAPYRNRAEFETAELLYKRIQMSEGNMNLLFDLWAATLIKHGDKPPFTNHADLLAVIDSTPLGDVQWQGFSVEYQGERPEGVVPSWMDGSYDVWFRDPHEVVRRMLSNPEYAAEVDYTPYREYRTSNDERQWKD